MSNSTDSGRIPVVFFIDAEPDEFEIDRKNPKPWDGFEFTHKYLKGLRSKFEEATNHSVHLNWSLMNGSTDRD